MEAEHISYIHRHESAETLKNDLELIVYKFVSTLLLSLENEIEITETANNTLNRRLQGRQAKTSADLHLLCAHLEVGAAPSPFRMRRKTASLHWTATEKSRTLCGRPQALKYHRAAGSLETFATIQ